MGQVNHNKSVKQVLRYIKIPDRRLISGLLYVNVVNNISNDAEDDFMQQCYDHTPSEGILDSNSFNPDGTDTQDRIEQGRKDMKHSFADYDCFLFYICGGMSLSGGTVTPVGQTFYTASTSSTPNLVSEGLIFDDFGTLKWKDTSVALTVTEQSTRWYLDSYFGDYCQHFVRSHLISRMNNASGHEQDDAGADELFFKHRPAQRTKWAQPGNKDTNDSTAAVLTDEWILSEGIYSTRDTKETVLDKTSLVGHPTGDIPGGGGDHDAYVQMKTKVGVPGDDPPTAPGHTYYAPVDKIKIYGKHRMSEDIHEDAGKTLFVSSMAGARAEHVTDWWDLVIDIGIRGNNPNDGAIGTVDGNANFSTDKQIMDTQVNVAFHPFGETADFDISETQHTS